MKVVTSHPAPVQGSAEACATLSGAAPEGLIGITRRAFSQMYAYGYRHRANVLLLALVVLSLALPHLVRAEDLLSGQKQDAKDTFGHGSTVEWGLYMAEVVISIITFIKTRNPALFVGGLAFLVVVTRTLFSLAG